MLVMILRKQRKSLRGGLSRWLMEVSPGIYLGNPSSRVRDELWKQITARPPLGYVAQIWSTPNAQGFAYRQYGTAPYQLAEFEGMALVTRATKAKKKRRSEQE